MVEIRKVFPQDAVSILPVLEQFNDPFIGRVDWLRRLSYPWPGDEPCGYAIIDQGKPVGFLGTIFTNREVDGRSIRYCNLNTWIVLPDYRAHSLALMTSILKLRDHVFTDFTPSPEVYKISKKLGFRDLDKRAYLVLATWKPRKSLRTIDDPNDIVSQIDTPSEQLLRDHKDTAAHLLISDNRHTCYVMYSVVKRKFPYHCHLLHASNQDALQHHIKAIAHHSARRHGCHGLLVDARFLRSRPSWLSTITIPVRKLYRGPKTDANSIDNLYSELAFGNMSTLPRLRHLHAFFKQAKE